MGLAQLVDDRAAERRQIGRRPLPAAATRGMREKSSSCEIMRDMRVTLALMPAAVFSVPSSALSAGQRFRAGQHRLQRRAQVVGEHGHHRLV